MAVLVVIADKTIGYILANTIRFNKVDYIANECRADVLIFGSSRAEYHYNAKMIEDSLGMSTYNCGASGYGIINAYGDLLMIRKHHHPKIILYDVNIDFDFLMMDNHRFINNIKTQYENDDIKSIIHRVDAKEKWKMMSKLYRFNSKIIHNPSYYCRRGYDKTLHESRGYRAQNKSFDIKKANNKTKCEIDQSVLLIDTLKVNMLNDFVASIDSSTTIIAIISPAWSEPPKEHIYNYAKNFFKTHNILFWDFSGDSNYCYHDEYFYSPMHLNCYGADIYTKEIVRKLRALIEKKEGKS